MADSWESAWKHLIFLSSKTANQAEMILRTIPNINVTEANNGQDVNRVKSMEANNDQDSIVIIKIQDSKSNNP